MNRLNEQLGREMADEFNIRQCNALSIGKENPCKTDTIQNEFVERSDCERYLDVLVNTDFSTRK